MITDSLNSKALVSVLIPTYNAQNTIRELIQSIKSQSLPDNYGLEIILVDSSSTDSTIEIVKKHFPDVKIKVIKNKEFNHGSTRNYLARISKGDYLLFMTQDAIPYDNKLILNLLKNLLNDDNMICFARQLPKPDAKVLEIFARSFNYPNKKIIKNKEKIKELGVKTFFNSNVCSMYKRKLFEPPFNGFPNDIILNEDLVLAYKVIIRNKNVVYEPAAKVYHSHDYNIKQQFKRYFDIGMAFKETEALFKNISNEKEGLRMLLNQVKYLVKKKKINLILYCLTENVAKLIGYRLGKMNNKIPKNIRSKFSAYSK
ncbi:glycosyltransferase [Heyndrickxia coagulans]|uniref:Glycosyltransferase 2-like domain-containing protein n=1 Tax=Heyndrickxia coagulans TaxID=1398 RepID=A0A150K4X8_HEYCO|nr:glycosyltransferase family 2 protein [Heyndrickxia coagulans]KYC64647.1 hypothetical protein B4098_0876 [Heyndrickxia coagulans]MED4343667.1 glycosyltransferase family 2 protein [Heyndrickxia coagulans]